MTCFECGAPADHDHHVVPRSLGGTKTIPLCHGCHGKAHGRERGFRNTAELTRAALAKLRAGGVRLGGSSYGVRHGTELDEHGRRRLIAVEPAASAVSLIRQLREQGHSLRAIASILEDKGHVPMRGGRWHATTINRLISRRTS